MQSEISQGHDGVTVTAAIDAYLKEHVAFKVAAQDRQEYGARHIKNHLGNKPLHEIDIPACREYVRKRLTEVHERTRGTHTAPSTMRRELNILSAAANHALRWKRITAAQLPQIELPEIGESESIQWLTKDQVIEIFNASKAGRLACFIRIAYYTAGRRHSIERLRKSQIDFAGERISLAQPGERMTKKRRPTVPLYPEIKPAVEWLYDNSGTEYLFGNVPDYYRPFTQLCATLGITAHPHMLRHSRATHMLMDGESIYKVAKLLGDTVATVEKVYGHSSVDFLATGSTIGAT